MLRGRPGRREHPTRALVRAVRGALAERGTRPGGRADHRRVRPRRCVGAHAGARHTSTCSSRAAAPRLIETVVTESTVPVIETGAGVVHIVLDETARRDGRARHRRQREGAAPERVQRPRDAPRRTATLGLPPAVAPVLVAALQQRASPSTATSASRELDRGVSRRPTRTGRTEYVSLDLTWASWTIWTPRSRTSASTRRTTPSRS